MPASRSLRSLPTRYRAHEAGVVAERGRADGVAGLLEIEDRHVRRCGHARTALGVEHDRLRLEAASVRPSDPGFDPIPPTESHGPVEACRRLLGERELAA